MSISLAERLVPLSSPYLVGEGSVGQLPQNFPSREYRIHRTLRTLFDQRRTYEDITDTVRPEGVTRLRHLREGIRTAQAWDIAKRAINGQDQLVRSGNDEYAIAVDAAVEHPALADHGRPHERRVRLFAEAMIHNIGEVRHVPFIRDYLPAAASFAQRHDRVQLLRQYENLDKPEGEHLEPKYTHATGGAILELLEVEEYARAAGITIHEAYEFKRASAYMIMKHDRPAQIAAALSGTKDVRQLPEGYNLLEAFENNELDLTTLSPAQLLRIHREKAAMKDGFITDATPNGLPVVIEERYKERLAALAEDTDPLLPQMSEEGKDGIKQREASQRREALNLLTEINVVADVIDMIVPPEESLTRKLLVPLNRRLPFYRPEIADDELLEQVYGDVGTLPTEVASVAGRALWEYTHIMEMFPKGTVLQSPYAKRIIGKAVIQGGMALEKFGTELLEGQDLMDASTTVQGVYSRRIKLMGEKAMRKANVPRRLARRTKNVSVTTEPGFFEQHVGELLKGNDGVSARFHEKVGHLRDERDTLIASLIPKQTKQDGTPFDAFEVTRFRAVVRTVTDALCEKYGIVPAEKERFRRELQNGEYAAPYYAYDSLAVPRDSRTIFPTKELVQA